MPTGKNLGPAIMNRNEYITQNLTEHLLINNYQQLSNTEAKTKLQQTKQLLKDIYNIHKKSLSQSEQNFFDRSFKIHCEDIHRVNLLLHAVELRQLPPYQLLEYLEKIWEVPR
jgi:hypothetical protein